MISRNMLTCSWSSCSSMMTPRRFVVVAAWSRWDRRADHRDPIAQVGYGEPHDANLGVGKVQPDVLRPNRPTARRRWRRRERCAQLRCKPLAACRRHTAARNSTLLKWPRCRSNLFRPPTATAQQIVHRSPLPKQITYLPRRYAVAISRSYSSYAVCLIVAASWRPVWSTHQPIALAHQGASGSPSILQLEPSPALSSDRHPQARCHGPRYGLAG